MAEVRLSDVIEPSVFTQYTANRALETNKFYQAGVIVTNPTLDQFASANRSSTVDVPFFSPIGTDDDPNIGSDDPAVSSTPSKIGTDKQVGIKNIQNKSWSSMDLVSALIGEDPMLVIGNQVGDYWGVQYSKSLINSAVGLMLSDVALATPVMTISEGATALDANSVINARQTAGDRAEQFTSIAMHSTTYAALQIQQLITFVREADNNTMFASYNGLRVIVDDALPSATGANGFVSVLFGPGAFGLGNGAPRTPTEIDRAPAAGNGEGQETLFSRKHFVMHPAGTRFTSASLAGQSPTYAEMATAANWTRVFERKRVPMAFIRSQQAA